MSAAREQLTQRNRKRTKVVATIGPASRDEKVLEAMFMAGMNVARLNMSHGDHETHTLTVQRIRALCRRTERPVAILADLQGPKIRVGRLKDDQPVTWDDGDHTVITTEPCPEGTKDRIGTTYEGLHLDVRPGDTMLIDDGLLRLRVEDVDGRDVHCRVVVGGLLKNNKGLNLPGVRVSTPSLSNKDLADLDWAIENNVDYIALSFVRDANDVHQLAYRIAQTGRPIPIIAKIEKPEAVDNIDAILDEADGIMVARGDLGIEISPERLPVVQKQLIHRANERGRIVITATQMLESMIENPIPTRAESSDVANAIFDGTDAIMLSGETAAGRHPVEAVREMMRIAVEAESSPYMPRSCLDKGLFEKERFSLAMTESAHHLAGALEADGMMILSENTLKTLLASKLRGRFPIIVACTDERTWRQSSLAWGVVPLLMDPCEDIRDWIDEALVEVRRNHIFSLGQRVVMIIGQGLGGASAIRVQEIR